MHCLTVRFKIILLLTATAINSCSEINTTDKDKAYQYWMHDYIPENVKVINGTYWESAHWSKEYVVFLELQPSPAWWKKFKTAYELEDHRIDEVGVSAESKFKIDDVDWLKKPEWFSPHAHSRIYGSFGGSKYFWHEQTNTLFVYEIQL
jgi:hypothetical protein